MNRNLKSYSQLIEISKDFNLGFHLERAENPNSLKLSNHFHPWSLLEEESEIVYDIIISNNLKCGFEIATAFGISASTIGQALKITNGKLVTMDAYVEEKFNISNGYNIETKFVNSENEADGFKMASKLVEYLNIQNNIKLEIGWSPNDVKHIIEKNQITKLDFAFIDGGHTSEQIYADVNEIFQFIGDDFLIFFHDFQCVGENTIDLLNKKGFNFFKNFQTGFNLAVFTKGKSFLI